jgi:hypothetical protein
MALHAGPPTGEGPAPELSGKGQGDHEAEVRIGPENRAQDTAAEDAGQASAMNHEEGARVLDAVHTFTGRFIVYPSEEAHVAHTSWIAHTHLMEAWEGTPRLGAMSPVWGSGKTRLLETTALLVPRPIEAVNTSPAFLFRKIADPEGRPTLLHDETDAIFGPSAREHEDLRALLNAGHRKGAVVGRCVINGKTVTPVETPAYCAVALAGLGDLPDTLASRSIVIRMRKRAPGETVEPFRRRIAEREAEPIRARLEAWAARIEPTIIGVWPELPPEVQDRDADVWEPLIAVADAAGGRWPDLVRASAVSFVSNLREERQPSLGVQLLADVRTAFGCLGQMATADLLEALNAMEEAPWGDMRGRAPGARGLEAGGLAALLKPFGVKSKQIRESSKTRKGYVVADLADPWSRYLSPSRGNSETPETPETWPVGHGD